ncbi:MAG: hypothetical protein NTV05_11880 [Acidobacteria bacterium]|nr:hypothetical protein [Acidobacteriota bacterium]
MAFTFTLVTFAWVFFRAGSVSSAFAYVGAMTSRSWTKYPLLSAFSQERHIGIAMVTAVAMAIVVFMVEWFQRDRPHGLSIEWTPPWLQWSVCYAVIALLITCAPEEAVKFLYADF